MNLYTIACMAVLILPLASGIGPLATFGVGTAKCEPSVTTSSGTSASKQKDRPTQHCAGDLIFEDVFDTFDLRKWQHENTLSGGRNSEFQWYTNNRSNSYCEEGFLYIKPTLTADLLGESYLTSGKLSIHGSATADQCTNHGYRGCERIGSIPQILNPVRSARLRTLDSFAFKYGKVEISAKLPAGDWLLPAIWFAPKDNAYGTWPASGEIDLIQSRGNKDLIQNGVNIGSEQILSTLRFGPYAGLDGYTTAQFTRNAKSGNGFNNDFHRYQLDWTPEKIVFSVDDVETGTIKAGTGFWSRGSFEANAPGVYNPWRLATPIAPFDQEFYLVVNLAVGGTKLFPDDAINAGGSKSWKNSSPATAAADFWNGRNAWLPTWNNNQNMTRDSSLIIDYVRVWAL